MRLGMNLLLWTDQVNESHLPIIERLAKIGFQGVEIPVFAGDEKHYQKLGKRIADLGLGATAIMVVDGDHNPISPQASVRKKAAESIKAGIDRSAAVGAKVLCGPLHSALGVFQAKARRPPNSIGRPMSFAAWATTPRPPASRWPSSSSTASRPTC